MKRFLMPLLLLAAVADILSAQPVVIPGDRNPKPAKLWGNDVQVTDRSIDAFDVDYRANGEVWLACISSSTTQESVSVYSSSDGGLNWSFFLAITNNPGRKFTDVGIVCGDTMLYVLMPQDTAAGILRGLMYTGNYSQTTMSWRNFATGSAVGIIDELDADRSGMPGDTMCVFYHTAGDEVSIVYSWNQGVTWNSGEDMSACSSPGITWVKGSQWAVVYRYLPVKLTCLARSYNSGQSWLWSPDIDTTDADTLNANPAIAACHGTGQLFVATSYNSGDATWMKEIKVYCATDGADTHYVNSFGFVYEGDQDQPTVNCLRFGGNDWGNVAYCDYGSGADSVRYAYNYQGNDFSGPVTVSNRSGTDQAAPIRPQIVYCDDGMHPGPAIFYVGAGRQGIYMSAEWLTGVAGGYEEEDAATNDLKLVTLGGKIRYEVPRNGEISLKIYNLLGQEVRILVNGFVNSGVYNSQWNGRDDSNRRVSSGVYLVRLVSGGQAATAKMVVVR
jgi:hypothetical protein